MKNSKQNFVKIGLFLLICLLVTTSCTLDHIGPIRQHLKTKKELLQVLDDFATSEENKNANTHRELFLAKSSTVNFVLKNYGTPTIATLTRDQWIGFFTNWDYEYFPVYSDINFLIEKGIALDSHQFQGYRDGNKDIYGNDLFLYANTSQGWKIVSIASTIIAPDDNTDYDTIPNPEKTPDKLLRNFEDNLNQKNETRFLEVFVSGLAPCFAIDTLFDEEYDDTLHSARGFFENSSENQKLQFFNIKSQVKDQYTAILSASYKISIAQNRKIKGKVLATVVGTSDTGWKITGMVFSKD